MITKINVVPATGIAGVPIATQIDRNAAVISWVGVILIPAAVAINVIATMRNHGKRQLFPFILMVIPIGSTKLLISLLHPSSSCMFSV